MVLDVTDSIPHPDRDDAQDAELEALRKEMQEHRDHRTMVRTLMSLASAVALIVVIGAVSVRDQTMATASRVETIASRQQSMEASSHARDTDDRGSREAIIRLTATVDAMRTELSEIRGAVLSRDSQTPAPPRR